MMEAARKISDKTIKELIERITSLDFDIKSGKIDKKLGLAKFSYNFFSW